LNWTDPILGPVSVVCDLARDHDHRFSRLPRTGDDAADNFAFPRSRVEPPLAGDHQV
jgi:hypothetical protein